MVYVEGCIFLGRRQAVLFISPQDFNLTTLRASVRKLFMPQRMKTNRAQMCEFKKSLSVKFVLKIRALVESYIRLLIKYQSSVQ